MCQGFGCIITRSGDIYFTSPDIKGDTSHSDIIYSDGFPRDLREADEKLRGEQRYKRPFVRIESEDWTEKSIHFDEFDLPAWVEGDGSEMLEQAKKLMSRVHAVWSNYAELFMEDVKECEKEFNAAGECLNSTIKDAALYHVHGTEYHVRRLDNAIAEHDSRNFFSRLWNYFRFSKWRAERINLILKEGRQTIKTREDAHRLFKHRQDMLVVKYTPIIRNRQAHLNEELDKIPGYVTSCGIFWRFIDKAHED